MASLLDYIDDFHTWVRENRVTGTDGFGCEAHYIPIGSLEDYWQEADRMSHVLDLCRCDDLSVENVAANYTRILSTLAYSSTALSIDSAAEYIGFLKKFVHEDRDDHFVPFKSQESAFPQFPWGNTVWEAFNNQQYLFCPAVFADRRGNSRMSRKKLSRRVVLPIETEEVISGHDGSGGSRAVLKKCTLHKSSNLPARTIVIKEFPPAQYDFEFENETRAYIAIGNKIKGNDAAKYFLQYYGSFEKDKKGFIMLEYADQGSLRQFFDRNQLPYKHDELLGLWQSIKGLFIGLEIIHNPDKNRTAGPHAEVRGVHQDLTPANIFVFRKDQGASYSYQFKIGDFGMSSTALVKSRSKWTRFPDNHSTKIYGAPELTHQSPVLDDLDYGATWEVDIWSLGCVLCEIVVWTICGSRGLVEFFELRQTETDTVARHKESGYSGCFHDGNNRLPAVDEMMHRVLGWKREFDDISEPVSKFILREMLRPEGSKGCRLGARFLWARFLDPQPGNFFDHPRPIAPWEHSPTGSIAVTNPSRLSQQQTPLPRNRPDDSIPYSNGYVYPNSPSNGGSIPRTGFENPLETESLSPTSHSWISPHKPELIVQTNFDPLNSAQPSVREGLHRRAVSAEPRLQSISGSTANFIRSEPVYAPSIAHEAESVSHVPLDSPGRYPPQVPPTIGSLGLVNEPSQGYYEVPVERVLEVMDKHRGKGKVTALRDALPDYRRAMKEIEGREQLFLIDSSSSMRINHWEDVIKTFKALSYLVKSADPNGVIELFLSSNVNQPKESGKDETKSLVEYLSRQPRAPQGGRSHYGTCNMENCLASVLGRVKGSLVPEKNMFGVPKKIARHANVYIFTDALWEDTNGVVCGVETPIENLSAFMRSNGLNRTSVALQFIQFGNSDLGRKRLEYLDNDLGRKIGMDFVDYRHWKRDGVWHMLVGSISRATDNDNTTSAHSPF